MAKAVTEQTLMTQAMQADQDALGQLLMLYYD